MHHLSTPVIVAMGAFAVASLPNPVLAKSPHGNKVPIDHCLYAAQKIKQGSFVKVEYLNPSHEGVPTYEVEVRDDSGMEWEFMCDATSGQIYEIEQEVGSSGDALFKKGAKISEEKAVGKVKELYPGEVVETEYEIEANGDATYEIDVATGTDTEFKVEVAAATGEIIEVHVERWEIGQEPEEKGGQ